jgi:hypothetical protein
VVFEQAGAHELDPKSGTEHRADHRERRFSVMMPRWET